MTTEQLQKANEINSKIKTLKESYLIKREYEARFIFVKFPSIPNVDTDRDDKLYSDNNEIKVAEISEWLKDEMQTILDRIKSKFEKKIKELEKELAKI